MILFPPQKRHEPSHDRQQRGHDPDDRPGAESSPGQDRQRDQAEPDQNPRPLRAARPGSGTAPETGAVESSSPRRAWDRFRHTTGSAAHRGGLRRTEDRRPLAGRETTRSAGGAPVPGGSAVNRQAAPADVVAVITNVVRDQVLDDFPGRGAALRGIADAMSKIRSSPGPACATRSCRNGSIGPSTFSSKNKSGPALP